MDDPDITLNPDKQPRNYGYVADIATQDARAKISADTWGATALDDLPVDLDTSCYPYRAMAELLKGNRKYTRTIDGLLTLLALSQGNHGSCVGWGEARKIMATLCAGYFMRGVDFKLPTDAEGLPVSVSPSYSYGLSRMVNGHLGNWEGSNGSWAAKATEQLGVLFERDYGVIDLSKYSTRECDLWEARGVPKDSLALADDTRLKGYARVDTCEQLAACVQNGYAVNVCGSKAPGGSVRGEYGEVALSGRWAHSQTGGLAYVVYKISPTKSLRFFMILNSHGSARYKGGTGSQTPDLPGGAYMVSWRDMQRLLGDRDTWVNFDLAGLTPAARDWKQHAQKRGASNAMLD